MAIGLARKVATATDPLYVEVHEIPVRAHDYSSVDGALGRDMAEHGVQTGTRRDGAGGSTKDDPSVAELVKQLSAQSSALDRLHTGQRRGG